MPRGPLPLPAPAVSLPLLALVVLVLTLLPDRYPASGFLWDWLDGLGFGALAVIVYLGWDSGYPANQPRLRLHSNLAVASCLLVGVHALGMLIADPLLLEYLKPEAPPSMLVGLLAGVAMIVVTITSYPTPRRWCYGTFRRFRRWHRLTGISLLGLSLWHVIGSGYSLGPAPASDWIGFARLILLLPLVALLPLLGFHWRSRRSALAVGPSPANRSVADRDATVILLLLILLPAVWAGLKNL